MKMGILLGLIGIMMVIPSANAETLIKNFEGGMDLEITYPDQIISGREGIISILLKNNGWEEKREISFHFDVSGIPGFTFYPNDDIKIDRLTETGSYGDNLKIKIPESLNTGTYFVNIQYSQILVENNQNPHEPIFYNIAVPVNIKSQPTVSITTKTPESIFTNAEFPFEIGIISNDIDITNVKLIIVPPKEIEFRGETQHSFSKIEKNTLVEITSRMITPINEVNTEYKLPFEIILEYTDDIGNEKKDSETISVVLRPRTFMELTTEGGLWVGDFFIAPYISIGTIVGIPAGALFSLLIKRKTNSKRIRKKRN
jgi:hypothetical protein